MFIKYNIGFEVTCHYISTHALFHIVAELHLEATHFPSVEFCFWFCKLKLRQSSYLFLFYFSQRHCLLQLYSCDESDFLEVSLMFDVILAPTEDGGEKTEASGGG